MTQRLRRNMRVRILNEHVGKYAAAGLHIKCTQCMSEAIAQSLANT